MDLKSSFEFLLYILFTAVQFTGSSKYGVKREGEGGDELVWT